MQVDALSVRLRPRTPMEAADMGVRLCQSASRSVYPCYLAVGVPVMVVAIASAEIAIWLPSVAIWLAKPWLDRTILFVLSRAAFGQPTAPREVCRAGRDILWRRLIFTWTIRRLSPWRSLTEPVYQLEGFSIRKAGPRIRQVRRRCMGSALLMTHAFYMAEVAITFALVSLIFWFSPSGMAPEVLQVISGEAPDLLSLAMPIAYAVTVLFLEPFYVAAGFGMYLNRRADLEAWDIEQELRRAFAD